MIDRIVNSFCGIINIEWIPSDIILDSIRCLIKDLPDNCLIQDESECRTFLISLINRKFDYNKPSFRKIIDTAAGFGMIFNYHEKERIKMYLDKSDFHSFSEFLKTKTGNNEVISDLLNIFKPLDCEKTITLLHKELQNKDLRNKILEALFGGYVFSCFPRREIYEAFQEDSSKGYYEDYYSFLRVYYPQFFYRNCSLVLLNLKSNEHQSYEKLRNSIYDSIAETFKSLNNHSYFTILIKPILIEGHNIQWDLYSDIVLFCEKFIEKEIKKQYFKPKIIEDVTSQYIPNINKDLAAFHLGNEGFTYNDCFILTYSQDQRADYDLLLIFQKNEADERVVPCPECRSTNVQGNSYPIINVRSWECNNPICPGRSKYNRGKRYSMASLIKQEAIEKDENLIPMESLKRWKLDVVELDLESQILEMIVLHYSLFGDHVKIIGIDAEPAMLHGRKLTFVPFKDTNNDSPYKEFFNSPYFHRFRVKKDKKPIKSFPNISDHTRFHVYSGDSFEVLQMFADNSIDGAVTSPPYYNAREYAQWDNIYCYLYDMYNIANEVYRVLKPGSVFLFNIFDYFDNENNIVFSAMGKKRMILGAYVVHLFKEIGFQLNGNIIWHKGEIEGKRNFNQGNNSPYYQEPFNCWEHIFTFSKGKTAIPQDQLNYILKAKPVMKMVKGKNILGHSAPFPEDIPNILLKLLPQNSIILDPFAGSMTTGRDAYKHGCKSINIEISYEYCKLGINLFENENYPTTGNLFK